VSDRDAADLGVGIGARDNDRLRCAAACQDQRELENGAAGDLDRALLFGIAGKTSGNENRPAASVSVRKRRPGARSSTETPARGAPSARTVPRTAPVVPARAMDAEIKRSKNAAAAARENLSIVVLSSDTENSG
jgi:hypothetical protein